MYLTRLAYELVIEATTQIGGIVRTSGFLLQITAEEIRNLVGVMMALNALSN